MMQSLTINPGDGSLAINELARPVHAGMNREDADSLLGALATGRITDHGNGFVWVNYGPVFFEGENCFFSLCFKNAKLVSVSWGVQLPNAPTEAGWPTELAIDTEVAFVQRALEKQLGRKLNSRGEADFGWGSVWSSFDPKGFIAAHGLRYR
jgi:hypothetical protein